MRAWSRPEVPKLDGFGSAPPVSIHNTATGAVETSDPAGAARMDSVMIGIANDEFALAATCQFDQCPCLRRAYRHR